MGNVVYYSKLNPVALYEVTPLQQPQYMSRYSDDYRFADTLRSEQTEVDYYQKWTTKDAPPFQFTSNFGSIQIQLMNCRDVAVVTHNAEQKRANKFMAGYYVYEDRISFAAVDPGVYYFLVTLGGTKQLFSEPMLITDYFADSLLFEYTNSSYHGDILFETGFSPSFRVEGIIEEDAPSTIRTVYEDQRYNPVTLDGLVYQTATLKAGKDIGVPIWVAKKLVQIFSCDNVSIDGKPWAVGDDSKMESQDLDPLYPMKMYSLKIQEGVNRNSKIIGVDLDPNKRLSVAVALDSTIFGSIAGGSDIIQINSIE